MNKYFSNFIFILLLFFQFNAQSSEIDLYDKYAGEAKALIEKYISYMGPEAKLARPYPEEIVLYEKEIPQNTSQIKQLLGVVFSVDAPGMNISLDCEMSSYKSSSVLKNCQITNPIRVFRQKEAPL